MEQKRVEFTELEDRVKKLKSKFNSLTKCKTEHSISLSDGTILEGKDIQRHFDACGVTIKEKCARERHMNTLQQEIQVLDRTITLLRSKHQVVDEYLKKQEVDAGIEGFHEIRSKKQIVEKDAVEINLLKGETLREISNIVSKMTEKLKIEREKLQPLVSLFF